MRRTAAALALTVAVGVGVGAGYIAFRTETVTDAQAQPEPLTAEAVSGSVGRTMSTTVVVKQPFSTIATNSLAGIVTAIGDSNADNGSVLFEVAGVPVHAIEGDTPMYRDLSTGAEGRDVEQLQRALTALGYPTPEDGIFGRGTKASVIAWQKSVGEEPTGTIALGTFLALPELPTTVRLGEDIGLGRQLSGGEAAVLVRQGEPSFTVTTTAEVASQVAVGMGVVISHDGGTWNAVVASSRLDANGQPEFELTAPDGGSPCGQECGLLPAEDAIPLTAVIVIQTDVSGVVVPVAAVQAQAAGGQSVTLEDGTVVAVTVIASQDGRAVVEGLAVGQRVRIGESTE